MFKKITNFLFLQIFIISLTFVFAEGFFYVSYLVTKNKIFDVLIHPQESTYPFDNSAEYIKIAVFGGSSSAGYNSVISFTDIIRHEINNTYPVVKLYIKNYAKNGAPFHRRQAEIVKNVIDKYDILLIYAGHNEYLNYVDNQPKIERVHEFDSSLIGFLEQRSRTYSIIAKTKNKIFDFIQQSQNESAKKEILKKYTLFDYITGEEVFPNIEKKKFVNNFKNDLTEILLLAKKYKKQIYVSSAVPNLTYWPMVSVYSKKLNNEEQSKFMEIYNSGLDYYQKGDYNKAIFHLKKTKLVDDKVAVIDFLIGSSYIKMKQINGGISYLNASVDNDGFPVRSINALDDAVKETTDKYSGMHYINTKAGFFNAVNSSVPFKSLFADIQHPSKLGHVIIAYAFLYKIAIHPLLIKYKNYNTHFEIPPKKYYYQQAASKYNRFISPWINPYNAYMIARWHIGTYYVSHADDMINGADKYLKTFLNLSNKTNKDKSLYKLLLSLVYARKGNVSKSLVLANESISLSRKFVEDLLFGRAITTGSIPVHPDKWIKQFNNHDIYYSEDIKKFVIKTNSN